jgi:integrase
MKNELIPFKGHAAQNDSAGWVSSNSASCETWGIKTRNGNHSLRATALTEHMKNGGSLAKAREMANHADTRTMQLYDRSGDVASLDEYGKVGI